MEDTKQSPIFNIVSKALVETLLKDFLKEKELQSIVSKVKYMYNPSYKDVIINGIYQKCEAELSLTTIESVKNLLNKTETYVRHVQDESEFIELRNILNRLTHNKSFFCVCSSLINATAATLLTLILSNQLIHAVKIVAELEAYLFDPKKNPIKELSDLLDMKYAILKFAQYKIFPLIIGCDVKAGGKTVSISEELSAIIDLPLKSPELDKMYTKLQENGMFVDNYSEYVAGLKIRELTPAPQSLTSYAQSSKKVLDAAYNYAKGHTLDGAVISPLSDDDRIRLTSNDLRKFAILDYLYTIRVLANCLKKKKTATITTKKSGTTLSINSPFKVVTVPAK